MWNFTRTNFYCKVILVLSFFFFVYCVGPVWILSPHCTKEETAMENMNEKKYKKQNFNRAIEIPQKVHLPSNALGKNAATYIKYNLMEETYGETWHRTPEKYFSPLECTESFANVNRLQQDHPCVVHLIRTNFLRKPAVINLPYQLNQPNVADPSDGQSTAILRILRNQTNGFFIECGALDGEHLSNTLYMERFLNWSGLLIEADQQAFDQLTTKNRKAFSSPACLSTLPYPIQVTFNTSGWSGSYIVNPDKEVKEDPYSGTDDDTHKTVDEKFIYKVQCFPLYSILLAVGRTDVDFFGLDAEGSEYKILSTVPWEKVDFKTLSVEWNHIPEGEEALIRLMEKNKFVRFGHIEMAFTQDIIFIKDFLQDLRQYEYGEFGNFV